MRKENLHFEILNEYSQKHTQRSDLDEKKKIEN